MVQAIDLSEEEYITGRGDWHSARSGGQQQYGHCGTSGDKGSTVPPAMIDVLRRQGNVCQVYFIKNEWVKFTHSEI